MTEYFSQAVSLKLSGFSSAHPSLWLPKMKDHLAVYIGFIRAFRKLNEDFAQGPGFAERPAFDRANLLSIPHRKFVLTAGHTGKFYRQLVVACVPGFG